MEIMIMGIQGMFKGLANTETSSRLPNPAVGTADYLVESIKWKENRNGGFRVCVRGVCLRGVDGDGNTKGDRVEYPIFSGEYFLKELKRLILCLADVPADQEDEIIDMMCPAEDYPKLSDAERKELAWEKIAQDTCALNEKGQATASGCFDGQVVVRLETIRTEAKPTGKYVPNPDGSGDMLPEMGNSYENTYPCKLIPLSEVAEFLDPKEIERFFGSAENFAKLLEDE
jgi:hypothetical protein